MLFRSDPYGLFTTFYFADRQNGIACRLQAPMLWGVHARSYALKHIQGTDDNCEFTCNQNGFQVFSSCSTLPGLVRTISTHSNNPVEGDLLRYVGFSKCSKLSTHPTSAASPAAYRLGIRLRCYPTDNLQCNNLCGRDRNTIHNGQRVLYRTYKIRSELT